MRWVGECGWARMRFVGRLCAWRVGGAGIGHQLERPGAKKDVSCGTRKPAEPAPLRKSADTQPHLTSPHPPRSRKYMRAVCATPERVV